jgi:hypothetical protein
MLSVTHSQKANTFQTVMGLFLLASGAAKREISVMAHTGLSTSYSTIIENVKLLSKEGVDNFRKVIRESMCFVVWDNINIAFRIASERLGSKNHFDNGTTATLLKLYNPFTGKSETPLGTLPLDMKPPRTSTDPVFDCSPEDALPSSSPEAAEELEACSLWYLKSVAIQHLPGLRRFQSSLGECPTVDPIQIHKTEQFPLPAMHINESSIDGTIDVYDTICKQLGLDDEFIQKHGIFFTHGDLLTDSLINKVCQSRPSSGNSWQLLAG